MAIDCEGCTSTVLKNIPASVVDKIIDKQAAMRKELKRRPTIPQVIMRVLKEWAQQEKDNNESS